jgi:hypothetical protein
VHLNVRLSPLTMFDYAYSVYLTSGRAPEYVRVPFYPFSPSESHHSLFTAVRLQSGAPCIWSMSVTLEAFHSPHVRIVFSSSLYFHAYAFALELHLYVCVSFSANELRSLTTITT